MSWMNIARAAKVVALVGFFLPWLVVSCQGQEMATATGIELAMGRMQAAADAGSAQSSDPVWWAVGIILLVVAGLIASFLIKGRSAALVVTATAGAALALGIWGMTQTVGEVRTRAAEQAASDGQLGQLQAQIADAIRIDVRFGYWITLMGLAGASAGGLMAAAGRRGPKRWVPIDEEP